MTLPHKIKITEAVTTVADSTFFFTISNQLLSDSEKWDGAYTLLSDLSAQWVDSYTITTDFKDLSSTFLTIDIGDTKYVSTSSANISAQNIEVYSDFVLKSPDNSKWKISIDNDGVLSTLKI